MRDDKASTNIHTQTHIKTSRERKKSDKNWTVEVNPKHNDRLAKQQSGPLLPQKTRR